MVNTKKNDQVVSLPEELHKPLYVQIQEYLADMILSGKLLPDTKINSERDYSEELGVSRMTVRRALTELVNEGLLVRRHGSGTYVARPRITYEDRELVNYVDAMRAHNLSTSSQLLEFGQIAASRRLAERLQLEIGEPLYRIVVLRLANRVPVLLERGFFPCSRCHNLEEYDLEKTSLYDLLTQAYGMQLKRIDQITEAVAASETVAEQLRVEEEFPLLMLSRLMFDAVTGKPVVFSQDFLRSDYARIHTQIDL
ncbi:MAG TPA: GntR family transcriptional regulator [Longilinea sp.]|nr:GntR family transcriptional regulator [Longilinea sp.]